MTPVLLFIAGAGAASPRAELVEKAGAEELQPGESILDIRDGEDDFPRWPCDAAQFTNQRGRIQRVFKALSTDDRVEFFVRKRQRFVHVSKNVIGPFSINVRAHYRVPVL